MSRPLVSVIVAVARNGVIGRDGQLPWHLPDDLAHFKRVTLGKSVVMGRRTHESIGRALPGRRNIVVTRHPERPAPGCELAGSLADAIALCADETEVVIIGGASLYAEALPLAGRLYLTRVDAEVCGDVSLPAWDEADWVEVERSAHTADARHAHAFSILVLERRDAAPAHTGG